MRQSLVLFLLPFLWGCAPDNGLPTETGSDRSFETGVTGSTPRERGRNPNVLINDPVVRDLVKRVAEGPVSIEDGQAAMAESEFALDNLFATGLLRPEKDELLLALNFLSADDQRRIDAIAREYGAGLAELIMAKEDALNAATEGLVAQGHSKKDLLYFMVGCVALDWDGLAVSERGGWRAGATIVTEHAAYTPWMKENAPDISRKGLYWGSHNAWIDDYSFTSFGDHDAVPRMTLPDLTFALRNPFRSVADDSPLSRPTIDLLFAYKDRMLHDSLTILKAVHSGVATRQAIAAETGLNDAVLDAQLTLLFEIGFLRESQDQGYAINILFLDDDAAKATGAVVAILRRIMIDWHRSNYDDLRTSLAGLNAVRRGVPYKVVYTEIWHYLFGHANRVLAERGLIADPYAESRKYKGFLPVVWNRRIYEE